MIWGIYDKNSKINTYAHLGLSQKMRVDENNDNKIWMTLYPGSGKIEVNTSGCVVQSTKM